MARYRIDGEIYEAETPDAAYAMADAKMPVAAIPDDAMPGQQMQQPSALSEAASNYPKSLYKQTLEPFTHPWDMSVGLGSTLVGSAQKLFGNMGTDDMTRYPDAFFNEFVKPYQSKESLEQTFRKDPARLQTDLAMGLPIVGGAMKGLGGLAKITKMAGTGNAIAGAGSAITKAGNIMEPVTWPLKAIDVAQTQKLKMAGVDPLRKEYASNAKFSTKVPVSEKKRLTDIAFREKIPLDESGSIILKKKMDDLGGELQTHIDASVARGDTVPLDALNAEMPALKTRLAEFGLDTKADLALLERRQKEFFNYWAGEGKTQLTMQDLQTIKTKTYGKINWDSGQRKVSQTDNEINKAFARAAKKKMDGMSPEIVDINTQWGELAELKPHQDRSASRIYNNLNEGIMDLMRKQGSAAGGGVLGTAGASILDMLGLAEPSFTMPAAAIGGGLGYLKGRRGAKNRYATSTGQHPLDQLAKIEGGIPEALMTNWNKTAGASQLFRQLTRPTEENPYLTY